jgi:hypothetical protein
MNVSPSTSRLHLLLALVGALTGTWWGVATAALVLVVLAARVAARRKVARWSSAVTADPAEVRPVAASELFGAVAWARHGGHHAAGL